MSAVWTLETEAGRVLTFESAADLIAYVEAQMAREDEEEDE